MRGVQFQFRFRFGRGHGRGLGNGDAVVVDIPNECGKKENVISKVSKIRQSYFPAANNERVVDVS